MSWFRPASREKLGFRINPLYAYARARKSGLPRNGVFLGTRDGKGSAALPNRPQLLRLCRIDRPPRADETTAAIAFVANQD